MTKHEATLLVRFIDSYSDALSGNGSNDFSMENTTENRQLFTSFAAWANTENPTLSSHEYEQENGKSKLVTMDWLMLEYLQKKLMSSFSITSDDVANLA